MPIDFRADQVQTSKIIVTGSSPQKTLLIYGIDADGSPANQGNINAAVFDTSVVGGDVFLYVSGGVNSRQGSNPWISAFGGDVVISGAFYQGEPLAIKGGNFSHAEGNGTKAYGDYSHAEGLLSISSGSSSHAEGRSTKAIGDCSHSEGSATSASGSYSHTEGLKTVTSGTYSHAEGNETTAKGNYSHAEGGKTIASGSASHAEGFGTIASGSYSHAEGHQTLAEGTYSHVEGFKTTGSGDYSHVEGFESLAYGQGSHAEGYRVLAEGICSHAEGDFATATGNYSHAEGGGATSIGEYSHAEGAGSIASGSYSHAEGEITIATGYASHAEGFQTTGSGYYSHAEGYQCIAYGTASHAGGYGTVASGSSNGNPLTIAQTVFGTFNEKDNATSLFVVGSGSSDSDRGDMFRVNPQTVVMSGGVVHKVNFKKTDYTILPTDRFVFISVTGLDRTATLPTAASVQIGHTITIRKVDVPSPNSFNLTINTPDAGQLISGKDSVQTGSIVIAKNINSGSVTLVYGGTTFGSNFDSNFQNKPTWFVTEYSTNTWT